MLATLLIDDHPSPSFPLCHGNVLFGFIVGAWFSAVEALRSEVHDV